jgi:hypothetical protein|tara:strand:+ start:69 stop:197 length:129 start_codon:yes stop_codon:yes gene_type:complete
LINYEILPAIADPHTIHQALAATPKAKKATKNSYARIMNKNG